MGKRKEEDSTLLMKKKKNRRKVKECYYNDICGWKRDSFFPVKLKLEAESFE